MVRTVAAGVEFLEVDEVSDVWRNSTDFVVTEGQLPQFHQTIQALTEPMHQRTVSFRAPETPLLIGFLAHVTVP